VPIAARLYLAAFFGEDSPLRAVFVKNVPIFPGLLQLCQRGFQEQAYLGSDEFHCLKIPAQSHGGLVHENIYKIDPA
jgi:hypothetical protein